MADMFDPNSTQGALQQLQGSPTTQDPNSTQGVLQQLLGGYNPEERNQAIERREQARGAYQAQLNQPLPDAGPIQRMVSDYLTRYASNPNQFAAIAGAAGSEAGRTQQMQLAQRQAGLQAAEFGAKRADEDVKESDVFAKNLFGLAKAGALGGKPPSPEQLRTVYSGARNEYAQQAKQYSFGSPAEREQWIEDGANKAVQNYLQNFATQPSGPRGMQPQQPTQQPQQQGLSTQLQVPPGGNEAAMISQLQGATRAAQNPETSQQGLQQLQALQQQFPRQPQPAIQPGGGQPVIPQPSMQQPTSGPNQPAMRMNAPQQPIQPVPRNLPQEAAAKAGATGMAESYVKDYEAVQQAAMSAEAQKQAFDNLAKIKPETNALANTQQTLGALFSALGQDPKSPAIQNAIKTRDANLVISQLTNAGLRAEKGVQTKSDETRIANEFPKTTDFQQVWNFAVKLGQERAQRTLDQRDFFDSVASANNGSPTRARQLWNAETSNDPLTQYLGGKLVFRNDFIKAYTAKHPELGAQGATQVWREMEQDYQKRGGRK